MSSDVSGGVSRSGRVRKKSAKLKEMEEIEKNDVNGLPSKQNSSSNNSKDLNSSFMSNGSRTSYSSSELDTPKKSKKLKIKFSLDDGGVEEMPIDQEIEQSDLDSSSLNSTGREPTVPSLKIKLFHNSNDNYCTSPRKDKKTPTKKLYADNENAANLLFQQITSGHLTDSSRKKTKKRSYNDLEDRLFDPDDEDSEEMSLVISDSNESLQAALNHAKAIKNPNRRLTETKIDYKTGVVKVKKVGCKPDKKQKLSKITAYTLFARENRSRIQQSYPNLDFANVSKRLGEVWKALPQREKMQWKRKAQKQKGLNIKAINQTNLNLPKQTTSQIKHQLPIRYGGGGAIGRKSLQQTDIKVNLNSKNNLLDDKQISSYVNEPQTRNPLSTNTLDLASHLHILGDSLNAIGIKLNNLTSNEKGLNEADALDLLLDSAVCAMSPLISLTNLISPKMNGCCDVRTQKQLLDNVAFLMPGI